MGKKVLILAVVLVTAFSANLAGPTCTLDASGSCRCVGILENQVIVGYNCEEGSSTAKCVCPPPPES